MKLSSIAKNKNFPSFIRKHRIFKEDGEINKIFPSIGLNNDCSKLSKNNKIEINKESLLNSILEPQHGFYGTPRLAAKIEKLPNNVFIGNVKNNLKENNIDIVKTFKDHYGRQYNIKIEIPDTDKWKIKFSSDDSKGIWDIATMSMRGISSCQSWSGDYRGSLIGSIIDPFCGIVYITDGSFKEIRNRKSEKMLYRCIVRYVVSNNTGKGALLLEELYVSDNLRVPNIYESIYNVFEKFLNKKTNNKLPILYSKSNYKIPNSGIVEKLYSYGPWHDSKENGLSYRDSNISYSKSYRIGYNGIQPYYKY